jgi:Skp family chaperone for outer membrane proteins
MSDFFKTRMGQRFYEATMPKIADQLERLNTNIEALVAELRALRERRAPSASSEQANIEESQRVRR